MTRLTIVTYHYVRPLDGSRYPQIKGLSLTRFERQLDYLANNYTLISMGDLLQGLDSPESLPDTPALLTFDDGYLDHFLHVFPRLDERGISGAFYPVSSVLEEERVLDVNKIQFILAAASIEGVLEALFASLDHLRAEHCLPSKEECFERYAHPSRWDGPETAMVKRLLQTGLPDPARTATINVLFEEFVGVAEDAFRREVYMDSEHVRCLMRHGMHVGSHGYSHRRLGEMAEDELQVELRRSEQTLRDLGVPQSEWTFCYPHGSWSERTAQALRGRGFALGLALGGVDAVLGKDERLGLSRVDTNQIPL